MKEIRKYCYDKDYDYILEIIKLERWQSFYEERKEEYINALDTSQTYVIYDNNEFCGYIRALTDGMFTLFIAEIIIKENKRGHGYGKDLINYIQNLFPKTRIDLISDADGFYERLGFHIFGNGMRKHNWY